jgi:hypothetical protein
MGGEMTLSAEESLHITVYRRGKPVEVLDGDEIGVSIQGELTVLRVVP